MNQEQKTATNNEPEVIELNYQQLKVSRSIAYRCFDAFFWLLTSLILMIATLFIIQGNPIYQGMQKEIRNYEQTSRLYQETKNEEGDTIWANSYIAYLNNDKLNYDERSYNLNQDLTFFFSSYVNEELEGNGMKTYLDAKLEMKTKDNQVMFDQDGNRILISDDYDVEYYEAYGSILQNKALGYLNLKGDYLQLKKNSTIWYLVGIALTLIIAYTIIYYLIPMIICNRGKRTLGMVITKASLLSADGLSCKNSRYTLFFLFKLFIMLIGSFAALCIPLGVSITMILITKSHQSLAEYVLNVYSVSTESQTVYKNLSEFYLANESRTQKENNVKDARLKL